ncbi:S-layer homology domain-containing protein [Halalkalibacter kiskunsagensis]|uniref:S-layer homology domain-containing protein n=1 Tax=Halalkalibacter kiskunsagensis TaxID=1548599 RepID=A0ABV6KEL2_9BACI
MKLKILFIFILCFAVMLPVQATTTFTDISQNHWAKDEIHYLYEQEIIGGYTDGTFRSANPVTRLQAARMIVKALGLETEGRPAPNLQDIDEDFADYELVATIVDEGIIRGREGQFMAGAPLTRGQMAAILQRAFNLESTWDGEFRDIKPSHTFYHDINALAANGITTGFSDHTFKASQHTSRAHFSVFLARALDDRFKQEVSTVPTVKYFTNLLIEAEHTIEMAMYEQWEQAFYNNEPKAPFADIRAVFLDYYTEEFTDAVWEGFYNEDLDSWGPALAQVFPVRAMEEIELDVLSNEEVIVSGYEPPNEMNNIEIYYEYDLIKVGDKWFVDDIFAEIID